MRLVVAVAVGLLAGFAAGRLTVGEPPPDTVVETRVEHRTTRVETQAATTEPGARLSDDASLQALLDDGSEALRRVLEDDQRRSEVARLVLLAALLDPSVLDDVADLVRNDPLASQVVVSAAFATHPIDPVAARKLLSMGRFPGDLDDMLASISRQASPGGSLQALEDILAQQATDPAAVYSPLVEASWRDPEAALAMLEAYAPVEQGQYEQFVVNQWIEKDAPAAIRWLQINERSGLLRSTLYQVAQTWVEKDLTAAVAFRSELEGSDQYRYLTLLVDAIAQKRADALDRFLADHSDQRNYEALVTRAASRVGHNDVAHALRLVEGLPAERVDQAYAAILPSYFDQDADGALAWWERLPVDRREKLRVTVAQSLVRTDQDQALEVVRQIEDADARAEAVVRMAMSLAMQDVQIASDLVDEVPVGEQRERLVRIMVIRAGSDREASTIGRRHGLSEEQIFNLRTGAG